MLLGSSLASNRAPKGCSALLRAAARCAHAWGKERCEERLRRAADDGCYVPAAGGFYVPANGGFYVPAYGSSLTCQPMVLRAVARCAQARIKGHCEGEPKVLQTVGFYNIKRYIGEVINIHTHSCTYTRGSLRWRCHKK